MKKIILVLFILISAPTAAHYVGEYYEGGIIFGVDEDDQHGLIAAVEDQGSNAAWYNENYNNNCFG